MDLLQHISPSTAYMHQITDWKSYHGPPSNISPSTAYMRQITDWKSYHGPPSTHLP